MERRRSTKETSRIDTFLFKREREGERARAEDRRSKSWSSLRQFPISHLLRLRLSTFFSSYIIYFAEERKSRGKKEYKKSKRERTK